MATTQYKRLTRAGARSGFSIAVVARSSLWLGDDHILFVETNGYTETYKRFHFRDIQSIALRRTVKFVVINLVLIVFIIGFVLGLFTASYPGTRIAWGVSAAIFLLFLLINAIKGETCRCYLKTAVQMEQLGSLNRIKQVRKVMERLRPLIAAAQGGELSPGQIARAMHDIPDPIPSATPDANYVIPPNGLNL